ERVRRQVPRSAPHLQIGAVRPHPQVNPGALHGGRELDQGVGIERQRFLDEQGRADVVARDIRERDRRLATLLATQRRPERGVDEPLDRRGVGAALSRMVPEMLGQLLGHGRRGGIGGPIHDMKLNSTPSKQTGSPPVLMIVLRFAHVFFGALWVGMMAFQMFFLGPALAEAGPDAGKVMAGLMKRRIPVIMPLVALIALVSGMWLFQRLSGGNMKALMATPMG